MKARKPRIIELPRIGDPRGDLTFVQNGDQIPFDIARVYWTYDVPAGEERGGHAHKHLYQLIVATSGAFRVNIFNGEWWKSFILSHPDQGLLIPPGYWRTLDWFRPGSVCMVLASLPYDETDYIRDFEQYCELTSSKCPLL